MAGVTRNINLVSSAIQYVIFLVTTGITLYFVEKCGRRPLLLYGGILMGALNFAVAGLMASAGHPVTHVGTAYNIKWQVGDSYATRIIACSYVFVGIYGFTWAPIASVTANKPIASSKSTWTTSSSIYCSEVFPIKWRAKRVGAAAATNWIFKLTLAYFVPPAFQNIVWKSYVIFGVFCFCGAVHGFVGMPETQGKTLEEIDDVCDSGVPAWKTGSLKSPFAEKIHVIEEKQSAGINLVSGERENVAAVEYYVEMKTCTSV